MNLTELPENDAVCFYVENLRRKLGGLGFGERVAAVEQTAGKQILLRLLAVRRRAPGEGGSNRILGLTHGRALRPGPRTPSIIRCARRFLDSVAL